MSSEHETAVAFAAEKEKDAVVDDVDDPGPEVITTDGAGVGGAGGAAVTVHVTSACAEPFALATRMASVWVPTGTPVSAVGDEHAHAGGLLSSAHVVAVAPDEAHANIAALAGPVAGGC